MACVGMGGFGKSQLALRFAQHVQDDFPDTSTFWIHGTSKATFEESYRALADVFEIPGRHEQGANVLALVRNWLQRDDVGPWFMVLDNADDVSAYFPKLGDKSTSAITLASYLPKTPKGKILVTSRSIDAAERLTSSSRATLQIREMEEDHALQLFREMLNQEVNETYAVELIRVLNCIPLAINQAAAFINRRSPRVTTQSYLDEFRGSEKRKDSLLRSDKGDLGWYNIVFNSVVVTWQVTFEQIRRDHPRGANVLSLMSCFQEKKIPKDMLSHYEDVVAGRQACGENSYDCNRDDDTDESTAQSYSPRFL
ncbi:hypothetical protein ACHAQH_000302 [Verticillium albo-atrum]